MGKIKVLPVHEAQKIAAGEVVERPAHILKELVENSIDADATDIIIYLQDGGKGLVRVVDNGSGMAEEDAPLAFVHHATSKISSVHDLPSLRTFGFRGEALSSISSVSTVTITTKEKTAKTGTRLIIQDAILVAQEPVACNTGTDIQVKDIFHTVPARKKFLKTTQTEYRSCALLFKALALAHPEKFFQLYHDGSLLYHCPKVMTLAERATQLYDSAAATSFLSVTAHCKEATITGVISNQQHMRYDRSSIVMLVNKRWVKNHGLSKALLKGYCSILLPGRYPAAILDITVDPDRIDINVHPKKEEVQFLDASRIEKLIETAVKEKLQNFITPALIPPAPKTYRSHQFTVPTTQEIVFNTVIPPLPALPESKNYTKETEYQAPQQEPSHEQFILPYKLLGQFHKTYILIERAGKLLMIDQHAAHEALLFEKFQKSAKAPAINQLIMPELITLSREDCSLAIEKSEFFRSQGIIFEQFGDQQLRVSATPILIKAHSIKSIIQETLAQIHDIKEEKQILDCVKKLHAMMACKAAVKAGDNLNQQEMNELITIFHTGDHTLTCPHGRPTAWVIPLSDIEKKFKRT